MRNSVHVSVRSFAAAAEIFREALPHAVPHDDLDHLLGPAILRGCDSGRGWVVGSPTDWPDDPPVSFLCLIEGDTDDLAEDVSGDTDDKHRWANDTMSNPEAFVRRCSFGEGNLIGTWNASGTASWCRIDGGGFLASVELENDQADHDEPGSGDFVELHLGAWRVEEGWAVALLRADERDILLSMAGLDDWPHAATRTLDVRYGE